MQRSVSKSSASAASQLHLPGSGAAQSEQQVMAAKVLRLNELLELRSRTAILYPALLATIGFMYVWRSTGVAAIALSSQQDIAARVGYNVTSTYSIPREEWAHVCDLRADNEVPLLVLGDDWRGTSLVVNVFDDLPSHENAVALVRHKLGNVRYYEPMLDWLKMLFAAVVSYLSFSTFTFSLRTIAVHSEVQPDELPPRLRRFWRFVDRFAPGLLSLLGPAVLTPPRRSIMDEYHDRAAKTPSELRRHLLKLFYLVVVPLSRMIHYVFVWFFFILLNSHELEGNCFFIVESSGLHSSLSHRVLIGGILFLLSTALYIFNMSILKATEGDCDPLHSREWLDAVHENYYGPDAKGILFVW